MLARSTRPRLYQVVSASNLFLVIVTVLFDLIWPHPGVLFYLLTSHVILATIKSGFSWAAAVKGSSESMNRLADINDTNDTDTALSKIVGSPYSSIDSSPLRCDVTLGSHHTHLSSHTSSQFPPRDSIQLPEPQQSSLNSQVVTMDIPNVPRTSVDDKAYINYQSKKQQQHDCQQQIFPAWESSTLNFHPSAGAQPSYSFDQMRHDLHSPDPGEIWRNQLISSEYLYPPRQQIVNTEPLNHPQDSNDKVQTKSHQDTKNKDNLETESDDLFFLENMQNLRFDLDSPVPEETINNPTFRWDRSAAIEKK